MKIEALKEKIKCGALAQYSNLYCDLEREAERELSALEKFASLYGDGEVMFLSVPGRSEISGNHTDHNLGVVIAGAINRDVIAVVKKNENNVIRLYSDGYGESVIALSKTADKSCFKHYSSDALIAGVINGCRQGGYKVGGFDAYLTSDVLKGSGISSSAAYEVMIANIVSHVYNDGKIPAKELAKIARYAENEYFGKPCGFMDQMACAVGGFVYIDFENTSDPLVTPLSFSLDSYGYALAIVNTGGNHADLNEDYASVPREMKAVASALGYECLRPLSEALVLENVKKLRKTLGDRAILRALHFFRENDRVREIKKNLENNDVQLFLKNVRDSGSSSFKYLQNVYTNANVSEQGLSLALALAEKIVGNDGAARVHGGGFAGTVQVFFKKEKKDELCSLMDSVFGKNSTMILNIRDKGALRLF